MSTITLATIQRGLALQPFDVMAAQLQMTPSQRAIRRPATATGRPRVSAVLLLLYCQREDWHILLTRRRDDLNSHAGQISFPGGSRDDGEHLHETALRETFEEVGTDPAGIRVLGTLETIYIPPSDFEVHPFVAWHADPVHFQPNPDEVAELLEVPIRTLLDPMTRQAELWEMRGMQIEVPFYRLGEHKVWGATAMMLSEFLARVRIAMTMDDGA